MRVIVISSKKLLNNLFFYLNPNVEIVALIIPEAPLMENYPMDYNGKTYSIYSYEYLPNCLNELQYDYILLNMNPWAIADGERIVIEDVRRLGFEGKLFHVGSINSIYFYMYPMLFKYITPQIEKYRVFVTGDSMPWHGTDLNCYELPALNIAFSSQDLYYNYLFSKKLIDIPGSNFKYAILGIAPWIFNSDISKGGEEDYMLLPYYRVFKDVHHFRIKAEVMEEMFKSFAWSPDNVGNMSDFNPDTFSGRYAENRLTLESRMSLGKRFAPWEHKHYPETIQENIEILKKFFNLCQSREITPILVHFPLPDFFPEVFPKFVVEEGIKIINKLKKEYDFHYLDKSHFEGLTYDHFLDGYHLNAFGAKIFSNWLNDYIMDLEK